MAGGVERPLLDAYQRNADGSLSGRVYGRQGFKPGELISTSVVMHWGGESVVTTASGSTYQLGTPLALAAAPQQQCRSAQCRKAPTRAPPPLEQRPAKRARSSTDRFVAGPAPPPVLAHRAARNLQAHRAPPMPPPPPQQQWEVQQQAQQQQQQQPPPPPPQQQQQDAAAAVGRASKRSVGPPQRFVAEPAPPPTRARRATRHGRRATRAAGSAAEAAAEAAQPAAAAAARAEAAPAAVEAGEQRSAGGSDIYLVEKVLDSRQAADGSSEYRIKWRGWGTRSHGRRPTRESPGRAQPTPRSHPAPHTLRPGPSADGLLPPPAPSPHAPTLSLRVVDSPSLSPRRRAV